METVINAEAVTTLRDAQEIRHVLKLCRSGLVLRSDLGPADRVTLARVDEALASPLCNVVCQTGHVQGVVCAFGGIGCDVAHFGNQPQVVGRASRRVRRRFPRF